MPTCLYYQQERPLWAAWSAPLKVELPDSLDVGRRPGARGVGTSPGEWSWWSGRWWWGRWDWWWSWWWCWWRRWWWVDDSHQSAGVWEKPVRASAHSLGLYCVHLRPYFDIFGFGYIVIFNILIFLVLEIFNIQNEFVLHTAQSAYHYHSPAWFWCDQTAQLWRQNYFPQVDLRKAGEGGVVRFQPRRVGGGQQLARRRRRSLRARRLNIWF